MADLAKKTKVGMVWNAFEKFGTQGISFVISVILARLLSPSDYGTIGLLTVFLTFSDIFIDGGFSRALIQKQNRNDADYSTMFSFNLIVSIAVYSLLFFVSPFISRFYRIPELTSFQRVIYLVLVFNAFSIVQNTKLQVLVEFKKIALITIIGQIASGIIGILFAYNGFGVWSLVVQSVSRSIINSILYWAIVRWKPTILFSRTSFKCLFGFGSKLLLDGIIATIVNNISNLVIGKFYGTEDLGYYTRGYQFPALICGSLTNVMNTATFPLISSLQNNEEEMIVVFKRLIRLTFIVTFPLVVGMAVLSKNIIQVLLTEKWLPAAFYLSCMSFAYIFRPINSLNMNILNAIGRSDLFLKVDLAKIPIDILVLIFALPRGIKTFVITKSMLGLVSHCINAYLPGKMYGFGPFKQLFCAWKGILSSAVMGGVVFFLNRVFAFNEIAKLIALIFIGAAVYYLCLKILREDELIIMEKKVINFIGKKTSRKTGGNCE